MKIGFIGLGNMGNPMAANLIAAGFDVTVHDLHRQAAENLLAAGAAWAESPRALAQASAVILTSLPGPPQVEAVMLGGDGVLAGISEGAVWIDMSTNSPDLVKRIAGQVAERGADTLDAPVTGAVDGAQAGTLTLFVGGDEITFDHCLPLFRAMGERVFHCGPLGTGLAAKLLTNLLWFINAAAIGEGLMLGAKAGIELPKLWEIIKSSAGNSWVAEHDVPAIFAGHYDPSFTLALCNKDLGLIHQLAAGLGVPLAMGAMANEIFSRASEAYGPEAGEMSVARLLEEATGLELRADI